jgi:very-short-patch-repair endonuclease
VVVEVDGGYHALRHQADARRDARLTRAGYRVARFGEENLMRDLPSVLREIARLLG